MLRHWFPLDQMKWNMLSANPSPHAIHLLSLPENVDKIDWSRLSANPAAIDLLRKHPDKIDWTALSSNTCPEAVQMLCQGDTQKIHWLHVSHNHCPDVAPLLKHILEKVEIRDDSLLYYLSANPHAISLLLSPENVDKIDWTGLSMNPTPEAMALLSRPENAYRICWTGLSMNPGAMDLLEEAAKNSPECIHWSALSYNPHPRAMEILRKNVDRIDWYFLSCNESPEAFRLLEENPDKFCFTLKFRHPLALDLLYEMSRHNTDRFSWSMLSKNPGIFVEWSDVAERPFKEDLLQHALSPKRMGKLYEKMGSLDGYT